MGVVIPSRNPQDPLITTILTAFSWQLGTIWFIISVAICRYHNICFDVIGEQKVEPMMLPWKRSKLNHTLWNLSTKVVQDFVHSVLLVTICQEAALLILKGFQQKAFSRMFGHDWLMLKHQPITMKHSAKSFFLFVKILLVLIMPHLWLASPGRQQLWY